MRLVKLLRGDANYEKGARRIELHSLRHLYPIEISITHSHVPLLTKEKLVSLNELRVENDLDISEEDTSPEDVSLLDSGMDFNATPASFQEQEIDSVCNESDLVEDPENFLPDYALSFKDTASSNFVPRLEEPLSDNALSLADAGMPRKGPVKPVKPVISECG